MARRTCDGQGFLGAFRAGVANLEAHVDEINGLNVYPVPDGDTGSNMFATVRAALEEAERVGGEPAGRIAQAISFGALMGARGNSGVITSQIFRGMAEAMAGKKRFNGLDLAHALAQGTKAAYGAVAKPVEGTILTVIRESSDAAVVAAERENDFAVVLRATVEASEKAVAKTPALLPILREAGVVDSGGQGIVRLFQGALAYIEGRAVQGGARLAPAAAVVQGPARDLDEGFGYETMYLLQARDGERLHVDAIRQHLESIGESVLVAGDEQAVKVHVHNERPDEVIGYGLAQGSLSRITVENLDNQARDVRETRAAEFTGAPPPGASPDRTNGATAPDEEPQKLAVIAVAPGEGLAAIFRDFGVAKVIRGGQSANPSTGELLEAVRDCHAGEIVLLPNNPNVVMAARQVAAMAERPVVVVPTRNAAEGFAALLALDPTRDAEGNVSVMTEAGRAVQTLAVTEAVRDATIGGRKVRHGQTIVLDPDDGLLAADNDRMKAVLAGVAALEPGYELLTLYYGEGAELEDAEATARRIAEEHEGVEVEVIHGGQPHYRYLIAAE
jgi:uncharacterized protein